MTRDSWDLRSPADLIRDVAERVPLTDGASYVALVHLPSTRQEVVALERLDLPSVLPTEERGTGSDTSTTLRELMRSLDLPVRTGRIDHLAVTIVVRRGLCVFGPNENRWLLGWRYSNHFSDAFDGSLFLVTEHGWAEFFSDTAGHSPALVA